MNFRDHVWEKKKKEGKRMRNELDGGRGGWVLCMRMDEKGE